MGSFEYIQPTGTTMSTLAIDTEGTGLFIHKGCQPYLVTAYDNQDNQFHWRFSVDPKTRKVSYDTKSISQFKRLIQKYESIVFHNANYDIQALTNLDLPIEYWFEHHQVFDTMIASHCYKSDNRHGLKENGILILQLLDDDEKALEQAVKKLRRDKFVIKNWNIAREESLDPSLEGTRGELFRCDYWLPNAYAKFNNLPKSHPYWDIDLIYGMRDVQRTIGLHIMFDELMDDQQKECYQQELTRILPFLEIQRRGLHVHPHKLKESRIYFTESQKDVLTSLSSIAKAAIVKEFNPNSPKQLSTVLFDYFKFDPSHIQQNKSGPSTDKKSLNTLMNNPVFLPTGIGRSKPKLATKFLRLMLQFRKNKTTQAYLDNYDLHKDKYNRIHTTLRQTGTGTGRLSCSQPNTMNVGKVGEDAGLFNDEDRADFRLRDVFGPGNQHQWFCVDYDQFQLRIFAVVSESKTLLEGFANGIDAHNSVAMRIFKTDNVIDEQRRAAKYINFGILFGAGPSRIEQLAGMPGLYDLFLSQFPNAKKYLSAQASKARKLGYVHTLAGDRLYVPKATAYAASCYVIQGTEAKIFKDAITDCSNYLRNISWDIGIVNPVHDELIFEFPRKLSTHLTHKHLGTCMNLMEAAGKKYGIPALVDAKRTTTTWSNAKKYEFDRTGKA